jgi:deazaflavin-dependent oxidoreductase (nitroreductase family)
VRRSPAVSLFWKIHPHLYRWSGGRIGGRIMNLPVLLLRTRGRKTGETRENALMYLPRDKAYVVIASVLGEPKHPAWWLNLRAAGDTEIQVGPRRQRVRAREAEGAERDQIWRELVAAQPVYDDYARRTTRRIPVVVLEPM